MTASDRAWGGRRGAEKRRQSRAFGAGTGSESGGEDPTTAAMEAAVEKTKRKAISEFDASLPSNMKKRTK